MVPKKFLQHTSPPEMMISLLLSMMAIAPLGCMTARSPEWKLPPAKAFFVASGSRKYCKGTDKNGLKNPQNITLAINLFHNDVTSRDNLSNSLSVAGHVSQRAIIIIFGQIDNANVFCSSEGVSLTSHETSPFIQWKVRPGILIIVASERSVCLNIH